MWGRGVGGVKQPTCDQGLITQVQSKSKSKVITSE